MGFRIQPPFVDIPEDDPFRNDKLDRREPAKVLTHLLASVEGPCVLAVDAAWGNGKTTFLDMWSRHLRKEGFAVVGFSAWETDFSEDPFIALSTELTEGLDGLELDGSLAKTVAERPRRARAHPPRFLATVCRTPTGRWVSHRRNRHTPADHPPI